MESRGNVTIVEPESSSSRQVRREKTPSRVFGEPTEGTRDFTEELPSNSSPKIQKDTPTLESTNFRKLFVNYKGKKSSEKNRSFKFPDNSISTTKYTPLSFLPKNLFEQFKRLANFYFLVIALIQLVPKLTNINPVGSIAPLIFVLTVTAVKEAIEDIARHRQDKETNDRPVLALREGTFVEVKWKEVQVGDIVKILDDEFIPADIILLSSRNQEGVCYIQTAQLDGETNLKIRQSLEDTCIFIEPSHYHNFKAVIECELPNRDLFNFDGRIFLENAPEAKLSLSNTQLLLRGCILKNSGWVIGTTVFTGKDTKVMKNSRAPPAKRSTLEKMMNKSILSLFGFMFGVVIFGAGIHVAFIDKNHWYLGLEETKLSQPIFAFLWHFLSFMVLFSYIIPISLYVSMELVKVAQTYLISQDLEMYHEESDSPANPRTSNLNEELGQIDFVFSDKTGTLTRNEMELVRVCIGPTSFTVSDNYLANEKTQLKGTDKVMKKEHLIEKIKGSKNSLEEQMLTLLAVCHTVIPEVESKNPLKVKYQASSPDEFALVSRAAELGFVFHTRSLKSVVIRVFGEDREYEILNVNEFSNVRKRMSLVVKSPEGKILLLCKGADSVIFPRLEPDQRDITPITETLHWYATEGLRTLCCAWAELTPERYNEWNVIFEEASLALEGRQEKLEMAAEEIEKDMLIVGATAIEDKLQVGVPEAIADLRKANLRIWVLTGDKQETAINIGFSCFLINTSMKLIILRGKTLEQTLEEIHEALTKLIETDTSQEYGLVIDGNTLEFALGDAAKKEFYKLGLSCKTVICCRVSPAQKRAVVKLVRDCSGARTLAIGDGANDASMIQEAHIGVGILGKEGRQAVMASDFAIAQFRYIKNLLLIHGRWNYRRTAKLVLYCFYKNMAFALTQFWFNFFSKFSAQNLYETWLLSVYNVVFTSFPILALAIFEQDVSASNVYDYPQLYEVGQKNLDFNTPTLWVWLAWGVYHSLVNFFGCYFAFGDGIIMEDATQMANFMGFGILVYTCIIFTVFLKIMLETYLWTAVNIFFVFGSILVWFGYILVYSALFGLNPNEMYWVSYYLFKSPVFWLTSIIVPFVAVAPNLAWKYYSRNYRFQNYHIIQEIQKQTKKVRDMKTVWKPDVHKKSFASFLFFAKGGVKTFNSSGSQSPQEVKYTGFGFSQEEKLQRVASKPNTKHPLRVLSSTENLPNSVPM